MQEIPEHRIRAVSSPRTITVYQAYAPHIGLPTARDGRFPDAWKRERMTWIKPSFLWMMYRSGWGAKRDQETVLALEISRDGFDWALRNACLSHCRADVHHSPEEWRRLLNSRPARVQWDPERDLYLRALPHRSLQLGLGGEAAERFADEWIVAVNDVTALAHEVRAHLRAGESEDAAALLPEERPYPAGDDLLAGLVPQKQLPAVPC
ncbi:DUF4291 domain-containing protein [Streptomyces tardus]|uniref:DUF4291 domain-containing protein n=1 Tax=Streptomyces tardus TaxID=2780544 RepID=UPI0027E4FF52|nr:DUF4291 domain-containing protein [Streptomyces tardus]